MKKILAFLLLAVMLFGLCGCEKLENPLKQVEEKEFEKNDFSITLTEEFDKLRMTNYQGYLVGYETEDESVRVLVREHFYDNPGSLTAANGIIELSASNHGLSEKAIKDGRGYRYYTYIDNPSDQELYYYVAFYDSYDRVYEVTFITPMENVNDLADSIEKWAKSVDVD